MEMCQPLRVYIVCQQKGFSRVLVTNIQYWGYEAILVSSMETLYKEANGRYVVIYDLDDSFQSAMRNDPVSQPDWDCRGHTQLLLVLSSHSVSRVTQEHLGAVALLQKPFEMGRLQSYLRMLQRLVRSQRDKVKPPDRNCESIRVLVVDDDVVITRMIGQVLTCESGYEVAVAHNGLDALERYLDWLPHCIVTDLIMPWMNGYQVMRCLSLISGCSMPAFVVMSALAQLEVPMDRSYLEGKAIAYIDKPFHMEQLLTAIKEVCARTNTSAS